MNRKTIELKDSSEQYNPNTDLNRRDRIEAELEEKRIYRQLGLEGYDLYEQASSSYYDNDIFSDFYTDHENN